MINADIRNFIPAGSSPGLTRASGQPLGGTYNGCSVTRNVPARTSIFIDKCNRRRCATCAVIQPSRFFRSSLTNRRYTVISECDLSCSATNVVYLISCTKCDHQYVGETKRKVSERLSGHRSSIKKHANTFIAKHFNLPGHSIDDIRIQPIEHITQRPGETEQDVTIRRLDRERFWMLELATVYPYGLNDRLQHVGNISNSSFQSGINVFNLFNRHTRRKRSHGHRRNSRRTSEFTLDQLRNLYNGGHGGLHRLLTTLYSTRLPNLHKVFNECQQLIAANRDQRFRRIVLDVCCKRLFFPVRTGNNSSAKPQRRFIKIYFHNKGIDKVNLTNILHNKLVKSKVPIYFQEQDPPLISYKYTKTISRSVFNYNQTLHNVNIDDYSNASSSCDCASSTFCYEPHGHVITGDLRIVKNRKLRRLLEKGPKYREQNTVDWNLNKKILTKAVDDYTKNWSKREGCHVSALEEWSETVKLIIQNKINNLQRRNFRPCHKPLEDRHVTAHLKELQEKYVLVPADKAGNNIIFVCKYYYMHTLMEELGINSGSTINSTYEKQDVTVDEIVRTHTTTLENIFHITLQQKEKNLPKIYWIPKLHKTPYKARFIAGSSSCTTTKISKLITECLKLVKSHCTSYCKTILERTGVNCMWIINNSLDVIHTLQEKQLILNQVSTWDFSTLYTSLPHAKLKHQLHDLLERVFNTRGKSFIATNNFHTFWANDRKSTKYTYFSCRELCLAIDFLIDNIYVRFGNSVFRQIIGIPMGTNSAPLLADLFLHTFEYDFMLRTMKQDMTKAVQFSNTFRYIDDLLSVNNENFGNYISDIYPSDLELKDTTLTSNEVCYLDTRIRNGDSNTPFHLSVYDKRDDFSFRIVNFPHMDSNIPANPAYGVYISQLVRYVRICTSKLDFIRRLRRLSSRLLHQGFKSTLLHKSFTKFFKRHSAFIEKYGTTLREIRLAIQN